MTEQLNELNMLQEGGIHWLMLRMRTFCHVSVIQCPVPGSFNSMSYGEQLRKQ